MDHAVSYIYINADAKIVLSYSYTSGINFVTFFKIKWVLRKWVVGVWTGLSWLRIGTGGRHL